MSTREEFEKWAGSEGYPLDKTISGDYPFLRTHIVWQGWQAATRVEREACARVCESESEVYAAYAQAEKAKLTADCATLIRARGDKS